ncbi:MAG: CHAP domain-containing protein [Bacteroidota bacterium]
MATGHVLLGFFCTAFIGWCGVSDNGIVRNEQGARVVIRAAQAEVGVLEVGQNAGKRVREYLAYTGVRVPAPYCASFVSWCFGQAGYAAPRTAWSPALFPAGRCRAAPLPGMVMGIYFPALKRIGHVGLVERVQGDFVVCIEGNTSVDGGREGVGVFRRLRHRRTVCKYADWL